MSRKRKRLRGWVLDTAVLMTAGAFQFSRLKYACLDKCRLPLGMVMEHWRGSGERRQALRLGVRHGMCSALAAAGR